MFVVGNNYTKDDLYKILNVPIDRRRGAWDTGYREYEGNIYIFSNVGIPGRTGHDYNNYWDGDLFCWEAKTKSNIRQPLIQQMLNPIGIQKNYLFTRSDDRLPYTYEGEVIVDRYENTTPVKIVWRFKEYPYKTLDEEIDIVNESQTLYEGNYKRVLVNKYERNPLARRMCIDYFGCYCNVCLFDFFKTYGELGKNYIHVHHLIPISSIKSEYVLVPEKDLIPVCPNCHSMIHRKKIPLPIIDLKTIIELNKNNSL